MLEGTEWDFPSAFRGLLPCDIVFFPPAVPPWALLPATLILFPPWTNTPTRSEGGLSFSFHSDFLSVSAKGPPSAPSSSWQVFSC